MRALIHRGPPNTSDSEKILPSLTAPVAGHHLRQVLKDGQITLRFENGYGVIIFQAVPAESKEILGMLVLRFHGSAPDDYQVAQYTPIPELNYGSFDEILKLCNQVCLWPAKPAGFRSRGGTKAKRGSEAAESRFLSSL